MRTYRRFNLTQERHSTLREIKYESLSIIQCFAKFGYGTKRGRSGGKSTAQETQENPAEETKVCPESRGRWIGQWLKVLASILEESTNDKTTSEKHPGDPIVEEVTQKGKAKCCLGVE